MSIIRFSGKYEYSADDKGRINFKKFLNRLPEDDRASVNYHLLRQMLPGVNHPDKRYPFFYIFTETAWNRFYEQREIDQMPTGKRMAFLNQCGEASLDSSERLSVPKEFLGFIGNAKELILQGDGDKIQVWNKSDYEAYLADSTPPDQSLWDIFTV